MSIHTITMDVTTKRNEEVEADIVYEFTKGYPQTYECPEDPPEVAVIKIQSLGLNIMNLLTEEELDRIEAEILEEHDNENFS